MNDDTFTAGTGPTVHEPVDLPLDYEAFFLVNQKDYRRFAAEMLGSRRLANEVVHQVFTYLGAHWDQALTAPDFDAHTRSVLHGAVAYHVHRLHLESGLADRLVTARAILRRAREALANTEDGAGLYAALAELPHHQADVFILRYCMGYTSDFTARILNLASRTVDYHCRRALASLEKALTDRRVLQRTPAIPRPRREGVR